MAQTVGGQVGPTLAGDNTYPPLRLGRMGDVITSGLHGPLFETSFRGAVFSGGMTTTSIANATFTTATLGATATPIIGLWNPASSTVYLSVLQATLNAIITAATNTGAGAFMWCTSTGNAAISTGAQPFNRRTFAATGAQGRDVTNVALTGLTNNLVVRFNSALGGGSSANFSFVGTAAGQATMEVPTIEYVDGSIVIPPGGVLALLCTTTPVAISAASSITWEEIPL